MAKPRRTRFVVLIQTGGQKLSVRFLCVNLDTYTVSYIYISDVVGSYLDL